jgi:nitrous oxidase accessory protein NosD
MMRGGVSWLMVGVVLTVLVSGWSAQPYTVCPSGCPFTKIQAALDAAKEGDTITVGPGVYRENLKITKSLSLSGADPAQVRLLPGGPAYALVQIGQESTLKTVRIEGFTMQQAAGLVRESIYVDVATAIQNFAFRNNRVLNREEQDWMASFAGDEVIVEKNVFSSNSTLEIEGRQIRLINNDLWLVRVNPSWGDTDTEALVEGNIFREEGVLVSGNTIVRKNRFRSAGVGIDVGGRPEVELVQVLENEFIGPGVQRSRSSIFDLSDAITVGNSGDRVLIEGNKIANYDVGILVNGWWQPSPEIIIRRNSITQGIWGIWVKEQQRQPSRIEIMENAIDRQKFILEQTLRGPSLGAGLVLDREAHEVELIVRGNHLILSEFGVVLLAGSGRADLQGNRIVDNDLWGVFLAVPPCWEFDTPAKVQVTGFGNEIVNNGKRLKPEEKQVGDGEGNVCPKELMSLKR